MRVCQKNGVPKRLHLQISSTAPVAPPPVECGSDSYPFKGECVTTCPEGRVATMGTGDSGNTCQERTSPRTALR